MIRSACEAAGIPMVEAAHRWMAHHSALRAGDAIIVGASKLDYVDSNVKACFGEPLPQAVIDAYDQANELTKPTQVKSVVPAACRFNSSNRKLTFSSSCFGCALCTQCSLCSFDENIAKILQQFNNGKRLKFLCSVCCYLPFAFK